MSELSAPHQRIVNNVIDTLDQLVFRNGKPPMSGEMPGNIADLDSIADNISAVLAALPSNADLLTKYLFIAQGMFRSLVNYETVSPDELRRLAHGLRPFHAISSRRGLSQGAQQTLDFMVEGLRFLAENDCEPPSGGEQMYNRISLLSRTGSDAKRLRQEAPSLAVVITQVEALFIDLWHYRPIALKDVKDALEALAPFRTPVIPIVATPAPAPKPASRPVSKAEALELLDHIAVTASTLRMQMGPANADITLERIKTLEAFVNQQ
ncbi:hypothetical protein phiCbK_043 [Caulobacter phage phiCbK]|uniref:Uncharacterized protein n=5 Tax=Viruses TaxID=10239 RepID=J3SKV5_9CAUD|nr:hypothetical protein D865_gp140 [Caulobacter phage phiCbK]AFO71557.1 hypothetical protein phiCbK_043 [Caulobacter phage phiCbK]AFU87110.1 hypothetical protein CbK_gp278 [Caulobacter phage phiCbK]ARB15191.1 hypothetical protein Ccr32_gp273 [Caulobacter phage Ccr32]ARB15525.1 hypothetical protein Ccr34_gp283 [Caulobacter phage Ccr34]